MNCRRTQDGTESYIQADQNLSSVVVSVEEWGALAGRVCMVIIRTHNLGDYFLYTFCMVVVGFTYTKQKPIFDCSKTGNFA